MAPHSDCWGMAPSLSRSSPRSMDCFSRIPSTSSFEARKTSRASRVTRTIDPRPRVVAVPIALARVPLPLTLTFIVMIHDIVTIIQSTITDSNTASIRVNDRRRWIALIVLCAGMLMIVLDATIVNVALPSIQDDLGFSQPSLAWVVNAYLITFGGLLLLAGRLGDLVGRRTIFLTGLAVFTAASLLCGLAQSQGMLIAARFIQGAGGAMTSSVILGMIVTMFQEPREQAKAIGVYAFVASAGGSVGLLAGGVLTQSINWHWIFFVNVPIGVATAALTTLLLSPATGIGFREGADIPGAVLITSSLMLGVYTIVKPAADYGWGAGRTLELGAVSSALLIAFIVREATARTPLIPLRIFRSRN